MSRRAKVPSAAQAKRIAYLWGGGKSFPHYATLNATNDVLVREGWVESVGEEITFPNGAKGAVYAVSAAGVEALGAFLASRRPD
ncbi:hypothetical protein J2847_005855 [Azospirillum agricola]|nr:hypothetical protein [Azospirillum agricola]